VTGEAGPRGGEEAERVAPEGGSVQGPADYALACVAAHVTGRRVPDPPDHPVYIRPAACFVSLKEHGDLRGCIGTLEPAEASLGREIVRNARSAALHDPRFFRVRPEELAQLTCSVDVLSPSEPCSPADLDPTVFGVIVRCGMRRGVLLPDLDGIDTVEQQVAIALQKAGILPTEPYDVERFTVTRYREDDPPRADDAA
jgi:AmmeMemoRadiSam system protein A